ncbi:glycosyltransferase family 2 protein [Agrococcus terreus]|uniref:glycosyltransferase family 2 protein n=1 Tax=Agrococcus terreus TaxID=574649 RepID=UPI00384E0ADC
MTFDVQSARAQVPLGTDAGFAWLRVESAVDLGERVLVVGWRSKTVDLVVREQGEPLEATTRVRARPDVAQALELSSGEDLGFAIVVAPARGGRLTIAWDLPEAPEIELEVATMVRGALTSTMGSSYLLDIAASLTPFSRDWHALVDGTVGRPAERSEIAGNLELGLAPVGGGVGIVSGWVVSEIARDAVWLEAADGAIARLDAAEWRDRSDVAEAFEQRLPIQSARPGFSVLLRAAPGDRLRLRAVIEGEVLEVGETLVGTLPEDPRRAAEVVFSQASSSMNRFRRFADAVARPVLEPIILGRVRQWASLPVEMKILGAPNAAPDVSIIVPLYGRVDFMEHQLEELVRDAWFATHGELVYVVDDPRIVDACMTQAAALHALYRVPMTIVWGSANRGYSGANNLGAARARGRKLLFLNSDAIPQRPGWLESLVASLDASPQRGAVAPRLLFADGSIQHARMSFRHRADLGVWVNHHPSMGLDPALDPAGTEDVEVPAITGACLLVAREDFDAIGGWDTGYLIGDFEDSDLCLRLRELGRTIVYHPATQLTHLERQSLSGLGEPGFRMKVVIYNAARHQARWAPILEELSNDRES